jgi:hypothetical protein
MTLAYPKLMLKIRIASRVYALTGLLVSIQAFPQAEPAETPYSTRVVMERNLIRGNHHVGGLDNGVHLLADRQAQALGG